MINKFTFNQVINKKCKELIIDCIYENKKPNSDYSCRVLPKLMDVGSGGGFRAIGKHTPNFEVKYVVLYSTNEDIYWQDQMDEEMGLYIYYGDNQKAGRDIHDTKLGGNLILKHCYEYASSNDVEIRKKIPPFFLFEKTENGDVKFGGLLVPGYENIDEKEWLTAIWAKRNEGGRFQNYKALFTVLDTSSGSEANPNKATINLAWLEDLKNGNGYNSKHAPKEWKKYIEGKKYQPLKVKIETRVRKKEEQLPSDKNKKEMLDAIVKHFENKRTNFEAFAIELTLAMDNNILDCKQTRPTRDGGRDGVGEYRIMKGLKQALTTSFAVEAKCKNIKNGVGVKETSRLISRIRHRQFGVFVTTSFIEKQAYKEIIEDEHPIIIISGVDIIEILHKKQINTTEEIVNYLNEYYPKDKLF